MTQMPEIVRTATWLDIIDIALVSFAIYRLLLWFRGTRAIQLTKGLLLILFIYLGSRFLGLKTIDWLMGKLAAIMLVVLIIVFQPELRRMLERLGRGRYFNRLVFTYPQGTAQVQSLVKAVEILAEQKTGSLIVLEREASLDEYIESGITLDGRLSAELLISIFKKGSPLHDGAVIVQGKRIIAAACLLPLSKSQLIDSRLGTRHRAAIGLAERTDALVLVTSEETGIISVAENGILTRYLNKQTLEKKLLSIYQGESKEKRFAFDRWFSRESTASAPEN